MQELFISQKSRHRLADGWADFRYGQTAVSDISLHPNAEYRSFVFVFLPFFIINLTVKWFLTDFE